YRGHLKTAPPSLFYRLLTNDAYLIYFYFLTLIGKFSYESEIALFRNTHKCRSSFKQEKHSNIEDLCLKKKYFKKELKNIHLIINQEFNILISNTFGKLDNEDIGPAASCFIEKILFILNNVHTARVRIKHAKIVHKYLPLYLLVDNLYYESCVDYCCEVDVHIDKKMHLSESFVKFSSKIFLILNRLKKNSCSQ
ncbi:hypothetical protein L9F63_021783, partial [Diploptera punctata]